ILGRGIKEATSRLDLGLGVRVFKNKGLGVAFTQSLEPLDVETTIRRAIAFSRTAQPDPYFQGIPEPSKASEVPGLFDKEIEALRLEEAGELARRMIEAVEGVRKEALYRGSLLAGHGKSLLMTSTGVDVESEGTFISAYIAPTYRDGEDVGSSYEYDVSRSLADMDFEKIGATAAKKAIEQFRSRRIEGGNLPVVLSPDTTQSLCGALLAASSGEEAAKARTFAYNLLGRQIAPASFEIKDDGTIPGAISSSTYDGEGVPSRPLKVVSQGVLVSFLHNSYSAGIMGVKTTGHAKRMGYGGYVGAGPTNVMVKPGDGTMDEMIEEIQKGILISRASLTPNMVSGELSSTIDEGFLIERGERAHPVKNLMIGGHIVEILKRIELISKEGRTIGRGHFFPAIKVSEVRLAGK
ncbi:TldD/PmbA family protein, partial [Candidatus Bathyarchaeota archaeon]|nr:TldD/PmbA family protein [Candidatus Bathyarchaeota archaeon]